MSSAFYAAEHLARRALETVKCKIAPLAEQFGEKAATGIRQKLEELAPRRPSAQITFTRSTLARCWALRRTRARAGGKSSRAG